MNRLLQIILLTLLLSTSGCAAVTEWLFTALTETTGPSHPSQNRHGGDADYRPSP